MTAESWLLAWAMAAAVAVNGALIASVMLVRLVRRAPPPPLGETPPRVTLIRPFRGLEDGALEKNLSLVRQDHPNLEVLFICEDEDDPGVPAARAACEQSSGRARLLFSKDAPRVLSGKVRNMIAGWRASTSPLVAFCDADIELAPGDLSSCARTFSDERVGASWMFVWFEEEGLHGKLWTLITGVDGLPVMRASGALGLPQALQGGLMVLRRDALEAAGGIEQLGDTFADDVRAGNVLQRAGFRLAASQRLLRHPSPAEPLRAWLQRFHRWTVCFRCEAPLLFFAHALCNATAIPLLASLLLTGSHLAADAWTVFALSVAARVAASACVDRFLLERHGVSGLPGVLLRPLADLLFFALCLGALVFPFVKWRGRWYRIGLRARIASELGAERDVAQPVTR